MRTKIRKWGNSLAVRIPKTLATEGHLERDMEVELSVEAGRLIVTPTQPAPALADLTDEELAALYAEFADGDRALAQHGQAAYAADLQHLDEANA